MWIIRTLDLSQCESYWLRCGNIMLPWPIISVPSLHCIDFLCLSAHWNFSLTNYASKLGMSRHGMVWLYIVRYDVVCNGRAVLMYSEWCSRCGIDLGPILGWYGMPWYSLVGYSMERCTIRVINGWAVQWCSRCGIDRGPILGRYVMPWYSLVGYYMERCTIRVINGWAVHGMMLQVWHRPRSHSNHAVDSNELLIRATMVYHAHCAHCIPYKTASRCTSLRA